MIAKKSRQWVEKIGIVPGSPEDYHLSSYAEYAEEDPTWFWPNVIPTGGITMVDGDPGAGKSTFVMDIISRAIRGLPFPDGSVCPYQDIEALYQCTEIGNPGRIARLISNSGAPRERVHRIDGERLTLSDVRFKKALQEKNIRILVVDPMQQFFEGDMNNAISARRELAVLSEFAAENEAAVILIRHFAKDKKRVAQHDGMGSVDISAIARSVIQVLGSLDAPIRYIKPAKINDAELFAPLAFEFIGRGQINWIGPVTEDDTKPLLDEARREAAPKIAAAAIDIYSLLREKDYPAEEILPRLMQLGHSKATIVRAKAEIGVISVKSGRWYWHLPE